MKALADRDGKDRYPSLPLLHRQRIFDSSLRVMSAPPPAGNALDEWHEWALKTGRGVNLLTRYLWADATAGQRAAATRLIESLVRGRFEYYFLPEEGGFSYYPRSHRATLDGASNGIGLYFELGAFSTETQRRLWGGPETACAALGNLVRPELTAGDLTPLLARRDLNSVRVYVPAPGAGSFAIGAAGVHYPRTTAVLDAVDLVNRLRGWLAATGQSMGNWVSRQDFSSGLSKTGVQPAPVTMENFPLAEWNRLLREKGAVTAIGFDILQVPRACLEVRRAGRLLKKADGPPIDAAERG